MTDSQFEEFKKLISEKSKTLPANSVVFAVVEAWGFFSSKLTQSFFELKLKQKQIPSLPSIGPGSRQLLKDKGYNTAFDLYKCKPYNFYTPTFGPAKISILNAWFNEQQDICKAELSNLEEQLNSHLENFTRNLKAGIRNKLDASQSENDSISFDLSDFFSLVMALHRSSHNSARASGFEFPNKIDFLNKIKSLLDERAEVVSKKSFESDRQNLIVYGILVAGFFILVLMINKWLYYRKYFLISAIARSYLHPYFCETKTEILTSASASSPHGRFKRATPQVHPALSGGCAWIVPACHGLVARNAALQS
jgi:hypothetical protein